MADDRPTTRWTAFVWVLIVLWVCLLGAVIAFGIVMQVGLSTSSPLPEPWGRDATSEERHDED